MAIHQEVTSINFLFSHEDSVAFLVRPTCTAIIRIRLYDNNVTNATFRHQAEMSCKQRIVFGSKNNHVGCNDACNCSR
jgi:hypothetical protein